MAKKRPNAKMVRAGRATKRTKMEPIVTKRPWKDYAEFREQVVEPLRQQALELEKMRLRGFKWGEKPRPFHPQKRAGYHHNQRRKHTSKKAA